MAWTVDWPEGAVDDKYHYALGDDVSGRKFTTIPFGKNPTYPTSCLTYEFKGTYSMWTFNGVTNTFSFTDAHLAQLSDGKLKFDSF